MANLRIEGTDLVVKLSMLEKIGALSGDVRVPVSSVMGVRITDAPYRELRGMRVGTALPWVTLLGRMVYRGGTDFVAIHGSGRTAIVELSDGERLRRLFVSGPDPRVVDELSARAR